MIWTIRMAGEMTKRSIDFKKTYEFGTEAVTEFVGFMIGDCTIYTCRSSLMISMKKCYSCLHEQTYRCLLPFFFFLFILTDL
jgi:hypothetical protein